jgi:hypothetical protein
MPLGVQEKKVLEKKSICPWHWKRKTKNYKDGRPALQIFSLNYKHNHITGLVGSKHIKQIGIDF